MSSSDIISTIRSYDKKIKEHQNATLLDFDKYISFFNQLNDIKASKATEAEKKQQLDALKQDWENFEQQNQVSQEEHTNKINDMEQRKTSYINSQLKPKTNEKTIIEILKSGVLDYKFAVKLIQQHKSIRQKIRDGKFALARQGNRVALISTDTKRFGYKHELTQFLLKQDNQKIKNLVLSHVPVYNNGSHVLSFDKDTQNIPDNVLKIYFSIENNSNWDIAMDARRTDMYRDIVEDVVNQFIEYKNSRMDNNKIDVHIDCSSYGIDPVLEGLLLAKHNDTKHHLSFRDCQVNMSLIPRSIINGIKPENTATKIDTLFQTAVADGYCEAHKNVPFVNLDVLSNDRFGWFEYHNIGSTNSFLKELERLQAEYNASHTDNTKQKLLVALNESVEAVSERDNGVINTGRDLHTGTAQENFFKKINIDDNVYTNIVVKTMKDVANDINDNMIHNKNASISKAHKDGTIHTIDGEKTTNGQIAKTDISNYHQDVSKTV